MSAEVDTKKKILMAANELFASMGFEGTSIRDIANAASVNVAAINYHFSSKETLYWQVQAAAKAQLSEAVRELASDGKSVEELAVCIYDLLLSMGVPLRNTFKMMLSETPVISEKDIVEKDEFGPPGGKYLAEVIRREIPGVDENGVIWAVKAIFTYIVHWALMSNTRYCQAFQNAHTQDAFLSPESIRGGVAHNVRATLFYLEKAQPDFGKAQGQKR